MGRRDRWTRKLVVIGGTVVLVAIMAGLGVASARDTRAAGYGYGYGYGYGPGPAPGPTCPYDNSGASCPAEPAYEWSGTVYDRHQYDLARCGGKSVSDSIAAAKLPGASVQLLRRSTTSSQFVPVPANSPGIAPPENPLTSDSNGRYRWTISAGRYEAVASKSGFATNRSGEKVVGPAQANTNIGLFKNGDPTGVTCSSTTGGTTTGSTTGTTTGGVGGAGVGGGTAVRCKVPSLVNKKKTLIRTSLAKGGCSLGKLIKRYNKAKRGQVTKVSPPAGTTLRSGYPVSVVVSLGPKPKKAKKS